MGKIFHVKRQKSNRRSPRARKQSRSPAALSAAAIIPNKGGGRLSPIVQDLTEDLYRADNLSHFFKNERARFWPHSKPHSAKRGEKRDQIAVRNYCRGS